ncbi:hypothetical protein [Pseudonocardia xishanensis]|uniref:Uncharacterized protein n=1 Tax=Pseudonocardia xishanensis TaxID=630995 RepID=A0ABP8RQX8_9PSEU
MTGFRRGGIDVGGVGAVASLRHHPDESDDWLDCCRVEGLEIDGTTPAFWWSFSVVILDLVEELEPDISEFGVGAIAAARTSAAKSGGGSAGSGLLI